MPSQHKHAPVSLRLPAEDRAWLLDHAKATGKPVNRILAEALAAYRKAQDAASRTAGSSGSATSG
jgi:hypothetical protein